MRARHRNSPQLLLPPPPPVLPLLCLAHCLPAAHSLLRASCPPAPPACRQLGCGDQGCPGGVPMLGGLDPNLGQLRHLKVLDLSGNALNGTLPIAWGLQGAFPALQIL